MNSKFFVLQRAFYVEQTQEGNIFEMAMTSPTRTLHLSSIKKASTTLDFSYYSRFHLETDRTRTCIHRWGTIFARRRIAVGRIFNKQEVDENFAQMRFEIPALTVADKIRR